MGVELSKAVPVEQIWDPCNQEIPRVLDDGEYIGTVGKYLPDQVTRVTQIHHLRDEQSHEIIQTVHFHLRVLRGVNLDQNVSSNSTNQQAPYFREAHLFSENIPERRVQTLLLSDVSQFRGATGVVAKKIYLKSYPRYTKVVDGILLRQIIGKEVLEELIVPLDHHGVIFALQHFHDLTALGYIEARDRELILSYKLSAYQFHNE